MDGDLLAVIEVLYQELTARRELERSFEDTVREIEGVINQMTDEERKLVPAGEPLPELRVLRERTAVGVEEVDPNGRRPGTGSRKRKS